MSPDVSKKITAAALAAVASANNAVRSAVQAMSAGAPLHHVTTCARELRAYFSNVVVVCRCLSWSRAPQDQREQARMPLRSRTHAPHQQPLWASMAILTMRVAGPPRQEVPSIQLPAATWQRMLQTRNAPLT